MNFSCGKPEKYLKEIEVRNNLDLFFAMTERLDNIDDTIYYGTCKVTIAAWTAIEILLKETEKRYGR